MQQPRTFYIIAQANAAIRMHLEQALRPLKLTPTQYKILSLLHGNEGITAAEMARRFFVKPQSINEALGSLTRRGLTTKSQDPNNRRTQRLSLTPEGLACLRECEVRADRVERELLGRLPPRENAELRRHLRRLLTAVRHRPTATEN